MQNRDLNEGGEFSSSDPEKKWVVVHVYTLWKNL